MTTTMRVQADAAQARFDSGELVLTLPMAPENRPRQIQRCYESSSVALSLDFAVWGREIVGSSSEQCVPI